jgi:hypothetical protein
VFISSNTPPNPFPALLSEPRDQPQVETQEAAVDAMPPAVPELSVEIEEPREHIITISRQA